MFDCLMRRRAAHGDIAGALKADNQMKWGGRINALRSAVMETVNDGVIFV